MNLLKTTARSAIPALLVIAVWSGLAWTVKTTRGIDFPTPWDTAGRLAALLAGRDLSQRSIYRHLVDSLIRWVSAFGIAAVLGIGVGMAAGWWRRAGEIAAPLLHGLQLIPGLAWIPVALLVFGVGERATVAMIAVTAFTPIAIAVMDGVRQVDTTYVRAAQMLGTRNGSLLLHVLLPGAFPALITGLRVGLGNGWRTLVAAEMVVGTGTGLGYSIIEARWSLDYTSAFACIAIICAIGLATERLVFRPIERRTIARWQLSRDSA